MSAQPSALGQVTLNMDTASSRPMPHETLELLVVGDCPTAVDRVASLLPARLVQSQLRGVGDTASPSFSTSADLIVIVGRAEAGESPARHGRSLGKPVLWLPAPEKEAEQEGAEADEWRRGASAALMTTVAHARAALKPRLAPVPVARPVVASFDVSTREYKEGDRTVRVTQAESSLLRVLLEGRGRWIQSAELRRRVFGPTHACHDSLIRVHIHKLRRKLGGTSAEIRSAKGRGYMFINGAEPANDGAAVAG